MAEGRRGKDRLNLDRIYRAAATAEKALPSLVADLVDRLTHDPKLKMKERILGLRTLMALAEQKPRMEEDLGLLYREKEGATNQPLLAILGQNITVAEFKGLSAEEREKLLLTALDGDSDKVKSILPEKVA